MAALDLGHVHETGGAADQHAARKCQLGDRLESAFVQCACAVGDAPSVLEGWADRGVGLESLKFVERTEMGVAVIEPDDEPDRNLVILQVV